MFVVTFDCLNKKCINSSEMLAGSLTWKVVKLIMKHPNHPESAEPAGLRPPALGADAQCWLLSSQAPLLGSDRFLPLLPRPSTSPLTAVTSAASWCPPPAVPKVPGPRGNAFFKWTRGARCTGTESARPGIVLTNPRENSRLGRHGDCVRSQRTPVVHLTRPGVVHPSLPFDEVRGPPQEG